MLVVVINGPAKSGKDTICEELVSRFNHEDLNVVHMEFKELLFDAVTRTAGVSRQLWDSLYDRKYKERPSPYLVVDGEQISPRNMMIHISENVMKPIFGKDVFGKAFTERLKQVEASSGGKKTLVVVSDGGFIEEALPVVQYLGKDNYLLIRLHRVDKSGEEYTFAGDSRNYLYANDFPEELRPKDHDVWNMQGEFHNTMATIRDIIEKHVGGNILRDVY